jgi:hypothetical protein
MGHVNHPENPRLWAIAHEKGQKCKLRYRLSVMGLVNHHGNPKLWTIPHENGHKCKNDEF